MNMSTKEVIPAMEGRSVTQRVPKQSRKRTERSGPDRKVPLILQALGAVLVVSSVVVGVSSSHAGAASLSSGPVAIKTSTGSLATNPLHHRDIVDVVVASNSTFNRSALEAVGFPSGAALIKVEECADPSGSPDNLPKKPSDCDPTTVFPTANLKEDGSVFLPRYRIYSVPDESDLGPSNGTVCDASHFCVLGLFTNQNDYTKPHLFSAPFEVMPTPAASTGAAGANSSSFGLSSRQGSSAAVSLPPATLANTGGPEWWPWLLGIGFLLLTVGTSLRFFRRPARPGGR